MGVHVGNALVECGASGEVGLEGLGQDLVSESGGEDVSGVFVDVGNVVASGFHYEGEEISAQQDGGGIVPEDPEVLEVLQGGSDPHKGIVHVH